MILSRSRTTDQRFYGVVEALVVEVEDPLQEGRVKIRYPWFDDRTVSEWCRVRQLYAGNQYGTFFVPEPGDEVLVAFVHGDMRMPIILGGLYNGQDKPPSYRAADKDEKLIRTREGHQLLFNDTPGEHQVELLTAGGHSANFSDKDASIEVKTSGGHELLLDDRNQLIHLKTAGGQKLVLDVASATITIEATSVVVKASDIKLGGASASQPLVLGNAMMALFNTHTHISPETGAPTSPPVSPMTPGQLSMISKTS